MDRFAISATLEARPGKESEVEEFLKSAQPLAMEEAEQRHGLPFASDRPHSVSSIHSRMKQDCKRI